MNSAIYLDLNTPIHRTDPRVKIIICLLSVIIIFLFKNPIWLLPSAFLILVRLIISGSYRNMLRMWVLITILSVSTLILWNFFSHGTTPLFWLISEQSLLYSVARVILILAMIGEGVILVSTTRNEELILGMMGLGLPYRVGFAFSTALRLVPTIAESVVTINQAQRSRGLDLESGNIIDRLRKYIPMLIPVFISTLRNANILGMALESKGFGAYEKRSFYLELHMRPADYIAVTFYSIFCIVSIVFSILGYGRIPGLTLS